MSLRAVFHSVEPDRRRHRDLRLVPVALAAWGAAAVGVGVPAGAGALGAALAGLAGLRVLLRTRRRTAAAMLLVGAGVAGGAAARVAALTEGPVPRWAAARARVVADLVVTDDPRTVVTRHGPLAVVPARAELVVVGERAVGVRVPVTVLADGAREQGEWRALLPSTRVRVTGRLAPAGPGWADAAVLSTRREPSVLRGPTLVQRVAGYLRQRLRDACRPLPADARGLIPGLVIGDTSDEPASLAEAFRSTGLTHLTAVSGENLVLLLSAALPVARLAGFRGRYLTVFGLTMVVGFTVLARPGPSMVRASVMSFLAIGVAASGRRARGLPLLCGASILLLLADPWLGRSYGFVLSLAATAGIFVLAAGWRERLTRRGGLPRRVAESLACTAAAEAFCLPVLVSLTGSLTPLSPLANLLAEFCVGPATILGAAALVAAAVWLPAGRAVAALARWPAEGIVGVARYGSRLPGAVIHWPDGLAGSALLIGCYAVVAAGSAAMAVRRGSRQDRP